MANQKKETKKQGIDVAGKKHTTKEAGCQKEC